MADERYEWLDRDAAERLLRGKPVEAADARARTDAARLVEVLHRAAGAGYRYDDGELPGEAAAMAAFRKARAEAAGDATVPGGTSLGTVWVSHAARPSHGVGFARPLRFGLAAAVAGCAIGGVAVAAGTGMLPTPFDDNRPLPASSVSAAATPGPVTSPSPGESGPGTPSESPGAPGTPPGPPPLPSTSSPSPGGAGATTPGGSADDGPSTPDDGTAPKGDLYRKSVEECRDYRSGKIDPDRKRRLELAAKGPEGVDRFCDKLLGGSSGGSGDGGGDNDGGGDGDGRGDDGGKQSGGSGGDGDGSSDSGGGAPTTPPVSWSFVPKPSVTLSASGSGSSASTALYVF
ncbi:hypothetical protein ACIQ7Q_01845 [Streptomyces sp. NPDC096176]|uniref:hypothetical protein n=1 Tax=Streptomyces sp. NPDC096176 TaxID=3366079 RepID=UPI003800DEBE